MLPLILQIVVFFSSPFGITCQEVSCSRLCDDVLDKWIPLSVRYNVYLAKRKAVFLNVFCSYGC